MARITREIARGAEAVLYEQDSKLLKIRVKKGYRHKQIDETLRKYRTRREARILERLLHIIPVPLVYKTDETKAEIVMDFIEGKKLSEALESFSKSEREKIALEIGKNIALMHNIGIIHGDLTTSNMIYKHKDKQESEVYFIDFGLAFHSQRIEDKAVDIYLLLQALKSKHYKIWHEFSEDILKSYFKLVEHADKIKVQLKKVEERGRYKRQGS